MKTISNSDYLTAKRLIRHLASRNGETIRENNAARQAKLLLRKWDKNDENDARV